MAKTDDDTARLLKAEADASIAQAVAQKKAADAVLVRAKIEASGKRVERNWETGETKVVAIGARRRGGVR